MHRCPLILALALALPLVACGDKDDDTGGSGDDTGTSGDDTGSGGDDTGGGTDGCEVDLASGVYGRVLWREGNWMPGDGSGGGSEWPLQATVAAFPVVLEADATPDSSNPDAYGRFQFPSATPVATAASDSDGCYALALDPGDYTVVSDDSGAWYCNSYSADGLCVVTVGSSGAVELNITVDYMAAY